VGKEEKGGSGDCGGGVEGPKTLPKRRFRNSKERGYSKLSCDKGREKKLQHPKEQGESLRKETDT